MSSALASPDLLGLRAELDGIDDALHDLLMRRAAIVAQVGALRAKGPVALRPGREAAILYRLLARNRGALDPATLIRVWREILSGSTAQQEAMVIAVADLALMPLVRAHFGTQTAVTCLGSASEAAEAVATHAASVAVLRWPGEWWTDLLDARAHIVARLPFWREGGVGDAMVLSAAEPDPSGRDRSLVGARTDARDLPAALQAAGFRLATAVIAANGCALAEIEGFVPPGDARLPRFTTIVGAYAVPLGLTPPGHLP